MFFFGPKVLLLLKRHSLEIYYKNSDRVMEVVFHSSSVRHLEVINRDEVIKTLIEAFKNANLGKQTAIILLSEHVVFESLIGQKEGVSAQKEVSKFYHDVPLEEAHIAKKILPLKGSSLAMATNREMYQLVIQVAEEFEWKIKAVIPITPFAKLEDGAQLTQDQVKKILGAEDIFKESDFLEESVLIGEVSKEGKVSKVSKGEDEQDIDNDFSESGEYDEEDREEKKTSPLVTAVIALFLLSLIIGSLFFFKIIPLPNLPFLNSKEDITPAASVAPEASASAQPTESTSSAKNVQEASISAQINKSDVKIHVLNGSGIGGQAAKIKEKLEEIGYTNVITGNIESSEASSSSIVYSSKLEEPVKDEINKLMDSLVEGVIKTEEAINEFNVVITLGKLDKAIE